MCNFLKYKPSHFDSKRRTPRRKGTVLSFLKATPWGGQEDEGGAGQDNTSLAENYTALHTSWSVLL